MMLTKRSVAGVVLLSLVTLGIYVIVWAVKSKTEMVKAGAEIPSAWLLIVPIAGLYFWWKFAGGVERVTQGRSSQGGTFALLILLGVIGIAIVQSGLNRAIDEQAPAQLRYARVA